MFKQKQGGGTDPFGAQDQETVKIKPVLADAPDVHETMKLLGARDRVLDPKNKRERLLCCCGGPGCQIGPMTKVEEVE